MPLLLLWAALLAGQTPISGVINRYTSVTAIDTCEARLTVTSTVFFQPGQSVLVMQMQGAAINQSNSGAFGDLIDPGCAGCWEKARIKAVTGTDIFLENLLVNTYDPAGGVQLVSLPTFEDARVEGTLTALPWNGSMGGVLALEVTDSLLLEADLDVSGLGFRGGQVHEVESDCSWLTNADDYHYSFNNWRGAPKGEGLARIIAGKEAGRGPQANGGGGGNDHNTGGGGGANRTSGGRGGKYNAEGTFTCKGDHPGLGGKPAPDRPDRIFFGGGGGAGHVNNSGAGTRGGNGGGIVIVLAKTIVGNGHKIIANGEHPGTGNGDGGGGGGGGGSIALQAQNVEGLSVEARGGNGADVNNDPGRCYGPGGGGAGGLLLKGFAGTLPSLLDGGQPGRNLTPSNQCTDPTHGATPGQDGVRTSWEGPLAGTEPVAPFAVIFQPESATGCEENQVSFEFVVHGTALQYQWQRWTGSTWEDMVNTPDIAGTKTSILTLFNLRTDQNGERFRCRVGSDCDGTHFSQEVTLSVEPLPVPAFDFQTLGDNRLRFDNLSQNASSYAWDFGDGNTSTEANPEHQYALAGTYTVTLEAFNDCGSRILERSVQVQAAPIAQFGVHYTPACAPVQVLFEDQSA
ncbi:MAG: PKD domain-containing protein, partial [Bacteroidetes bacterium]